MDQPRFDGKSAKEIRKDLSIIIDEIGKIFEDIAKKRGFDFKCKKSDPNYVMLGGSNRACTLFLWHDSTVLKKRTFIKVQFSFVEDICTKPKRVMLNSAVNKKDEDLKVIFSEYKEYSKPIPFLVYSTKEILSEKVRALLTRKGVKARDFLDIYFIQNNLGIKVTDVEKYVIRKTNHTLKIYEKYRNNFKDKKKRIEQNNIFEWGKEKDLLISKIDNNDFNKFIRSFTEYLKELVKRINI